MTRAELTERTIVRVLVAERLRLKVTQKAVAEELGLSHATVSKLEAGSQRASLLQAVQWAHALNMSLAHVADLARERMLG